MTPAQRVLRRVVPLVAGLAAVTCVASCTGTAAGDPSQDGATADSPTRKSQVVRVEQRDLVSVLVVAGQVVAFPRYTVATPRRGGLELTVRAGDRVKAGMVLGRVGGHPFRVPRGGTVVSVRGERSSVPANAPVVVVQHGGFGIQTTVSGADMYRVYEGVVSARASLSPGPGGVECTVVPAPVEADAVPQVGGDGGPPGAASAGLATVCLLPEDITAFEGLHAKVGLRTASARKALVLPISAVAGTSQEGDVITVAADGTRRPRHVKLGITDGSYIQVTEGLALGDQVLAQAPVFP